MAKGSRKLNMKRDDARTLMLKMDARLTYAGRERNASFKLEGERELKHIQVTHQLIEAELNRAKQDVQRRFDFYQTLKEQNKERREKRNLAWCEEEEGVRDRKARAARRRRLLPQLKVHHIKNHKAEAVGSIRRDVKGEYTHKMTQETHLNRSLIALSDSYSKHRTLTERNQAKLAQITEDRDAFGVPAEVEGNTLPTKMEENRREAEIRTPKYGMRFPARGLGKTGESSAGPSACLGQHFYMNTSTVREHHGEGIGSLYQDMQALPSINRTRRKGVYAMDVADSAGVGGGALTRTGRLFHSLDHPSKLTKKPRPGPSLTLGPQQVIPLRFYGSEKNPFLRESVGPPSAVHRSRDLINADKDSEMYEWLGFESREELEKLRAAGLLLEGKREEGLDTSDNLEDGTRVAMMDTREAPDNTK